MNVIDLSFFIDILKILEKIKRLLNVFILWFKKRRRVIVNENL